MVKRIIAIVTSLVVFVTSLVAIFTAPRSYEYRDLVYGEHQRHVLDLYIPMRNDGEVGLVFFIHGGGFISGDKAGYLEQIQEIANKKKFATAAMNYRYLGKDVDINDILDDIDLALKCVKDKAQEQGVNINKVVLRGYSAGGHLSMLYGYSKAETAPIKPVAVVTDCGGPVDFTDIAFYRQSAWMNPDAMAEHMSMACGKSFTLDTIDSAREELLKVSPITYVNEDTVPTLMSYGMKDEIILYSHAQMLHNKLFECGVKCDLVSYPNSGHGLEGDKNNRRKTEMLFEEYCETYLK
ncbi:MAG: alpha/beta hydrolase [Clostridia bacterium]|nr:alpha/beta hydrolase [Clostridia bacterium]